MTTTDQTNKVEQRHMKRADELFNDVAVGVRYSAYKGAAVAYIAQAFASFEAEILAQHQADNGWNFNMEDAPRDGAVFSGWVEEDKAGKISHKIVHEVRFYDNEWQYNHPHGWVSLNMINWVKRKPIAFKPILLPEQMELSE